MQRYGSAPNSSGGPCSTSGNAGSAAGSGSTGPSLASGVAGGRPQREAARKCNLRMRAQIVPSPAPRRAPRRDSGAPGAPDSAGAAAVPSGPPKAPLFIASFMFKGGVYKTTSVVNLASILAGDLMKKKVVLIDADPQCSATFFFQEYIKMGSQEEAQRAEQGKAAVENFVARHRANALAENLPEVECERLSDEWNPIPPEQYKNSEWLQFEVQGFDAQNNRVTRTERAENIYSALQYMNSTTEAGRKAPTLLEVKDAPFDNGHKEYGGRLLLLPGSGDLIREETKLEELGLKNGLQRRGAFRMLMQKICDSEAASGRDNVDVVLVDLGPNNGVFNKVFAMSCDYILSPVHAEYFSAASVTMFLDNVLSDWQKWRDEHIAYLDANPIEKSDIQSSGYYCFESSPKLLPFIAQGYEMHPPPVSQGSGSVPMTDRSVYDSNDQFIKSMRWIVAEAAKPSVVGMFKTAANGEMVMPLLPALKFSSVAQELGVSLMHVGQKQLEEYYHNKTDPGHGTKLFNNDQFKEERKLVESRFLSLGQFIMALAVPIAPTVAPIAPAPAPPGGGPPPTAAAGS